MASVAVLLVFVLAGTSHALIFGAKEKNKITVGRVSVLNGGNVTSLSELGCGTWSWGNRLLFNYDPSQDNEIYRSYVLLRKGGVTVFDTADSYGTLDLNGRAEYLLGEFERRYQQEIELDDNKNVRNNPTSLFGSAGFLGQQPRPLLQSKDQQQQVATKFAPYPWRITRQSFVQAAKESLKRLNQPQLAIAQAHWSTSNYQPLQEGAVWEGLGDCYDSGLAQAVGVSNYGPQQLLNASRRFQERNVPLATAQIQYSLMTYQVATQMNAACDEIDCRLIAYSPLCLGLLTGKYNLDNLPRPGNPRRQLFRELLAPNSGTQGLLDTLQAIASEYGKTLPQVAINWTLCKGTVPIPGCRTVQQATENLGATGWRLKTDAVGELDRVAALVKKPMIQNIFQTR
ncbi:hypothetical protein ACA910_003128 [Epithemia clementina (nom. ined.)]